MVWLQSHAILLLGIWSMLHVFALQVSAAYPPTTRIGKIAHVWCALNPLDFVKAFRTATAGSAEAP